MANYIFGGSTGETPQSLARKRAIVEALMSQRNAAPKNVGEGLSAVGDALAFRAMMNQLDTADKSGQSAADEAWNPILESFSKSPDESAGGGDYASAISGIESGGRYDALGPQTRTGDRAYGKYQVMGANVGPWTQEALGRELSPQEFLASPEAQDTVFQTKFGSYADKYGGPEGAARAWFAGEGGMNDPSRSDQLGTSVADYAQKFNAGMGEQPASGGGISLEQLIAAAGQPYMSEGRQKIINLLLEKELGKRYPDQGEPFTLGEGQTRFDSTGKPIAAGSPAMTKAPQVETFYDEKTGQEYKARWNPQTGQYERVGGLKAPSGTSLTVGPDGEVQFTQGATKPMTEAQSKDTVFVTRAAGALPLIDTYGDALTSFGENVAARAPLVGNYMKTPEYQQAEQAGKEFLQAILRKDTGAAITKEETEEYGSVYLPRPGDSAPVLQQKKASRRRAIIAIQNGLSPAAVLALEKGGVPLVTPTAPPQPDDWQVIDGVRIRVKPNAGF